MARGKMKRIFYGICILSTAFMLFFAYQAYDKKNNYHNSDYDLLNENAYVGGDAYNYIINAGYFAGYASLAGASGVVAVLSFGTACLLSVTKTGEDDNIDEQRMTTRKTGQNSGHTRASLVVTSEEDI